MIPLFSFFSSFFFEPDADLLFFFRGVRGLGTRDTETYFPASANRCFRHLQLCFGGFFVPTRHRSPTRSVFLPCVRPCSSTGWATHDRMHGPSGMTGVCCDAGRMRVFGGGHAACRGGGPAVFIAQLSRLFPRTQRMIPETRRAS